MIFSEPRDSTQLDKELLEYYSTIDNVGKTKKHAVLFAVCRGKVSEGIDFSDNYARTVVIVGMPFASLGSVQVKLKRLYQDDKCRADNSGTVLSGEQWYCQQAYRAVNQAVGRCIRHVRDFGAVILCDPRFQNKASQQQLSRWLRPCVRAMHGVEDVILPLRMFFSENFTRFKDHLAVLDAKKNASAMELMQASEISRTAAHDEMQQRSKLQRERRKGRKRKAGVTGPAESTETGGCVSEEGSKQQTTLSQMFQRYVPRSIKPDPDACCTEDQNLLELGLSLSQSLKTAEVRREKDAYVGDCEDEQVETGGGIQLVQNQHSSYDYSTLLENFSFEKKTRADSHSPRETSAHSSLTSQPSLDYCTLLAVADVMESWEWGVVGEGSWKRDCERGGSVRVLPLCPKTIPYLSCRLGYSVGTDTTPLGAYLVDWTYNMSASHATTTLCTSASEEMETCFQGPFQRTTTAVSKMQGALSVEELWCAEDGVVYRLLVAPRSKSRCTGIMKSSNMQPEQEHHPEDRIIIAAKVIACSSGKFHLMNSCIANLAVMLMCSDSFLNTTKAYSDTDPSSPQRKVVYVSEGGNMGPFSINSGAPSSMLVKSLVSHQPHKSLMASSTPTCAVAALTSFAASPPTNRCKGASVTKLHPKAGQDAECSDDDIFMVTSSVPSARRSSAGSSVARNKTTSKKT